ncbi:MAG: hypothetical protein IT366_19540 [Candidatus Hydrogenedentes bacterium]|nr:hypothetical protein [Candidatus Hydrogenedentota bacterium]
MEHCVTIRGTDEISDAALDAFFGNKSSDGAYIIMTDETLDIKIGPITLRSGEHLSSPTSMPKMDVLAKAKCAAITAELLPGIEPKTVGALRKLVQSSLSFDALVKGMRKAAKTLSISFPRSEMDGTLPPELETKIKTWADQRLFVEKSRQYSRLAQRDIILYLASNHSEDLRACTNADNPETLYCFNGKIWTTNTGTPLRRLINEKLDRERHVAEMTSNVPLANSAAFLGQDAQVKAMINSVTYEVPTIGKEDFNLANELLVFNNGTYCLESGRFFPGEFYKEKYLTTYCKYDYAQSTYDIEPEMAQVFGDEWVVAKKVLGYSLTGEMSLKKLFVIQGEGDSGKTQLLRFISILLGDPLAVCIDGNQIFKQKGEDKFGLEAIKVARVVSVPDPPHNAHFNEGRVKAWTGSDPIIVRPMYQSPYSILPKFKMLIACNTIPKISVIEEATRNRLFLLRTKRINNPITDWSTKILSNPEKRNAALRVLLEGAKEFYALRASNTSLQMTSQSAQELRQHFNDIDPFAEWLDAHYEYGKDVKGEILFNQLWASYCTVMDATQKDRHTSAQSFGKALSAVGIGDRKSNGQTYRTGIKSKMLARR